MKRCINCQPGRLGKYCIQPNSNQPDTTFPIANARDKQPTNDDDASDTVNEQPNILNEQPVICLKLLLVSRGKTLFMKTHGYFSCMQIRQQWRVSLKAVMILTHSVHRPHNQSTVRGNQIVVISNGLNRQLNYPVVLAGV